MTTEIIDTVVTDDPDTKTRTTVIRTKHFAPGEKWHSKDDVAKKERESEAKWLELDDETRQALVLLITDILKQMIDDPNMWIPTSMVPATDNKLDLWVGINFDEIEDEVISRRLEAEKELMEVQSDLVRLGRELGGDTSAVEAVKDAAAIKGLADMVKRRTEATVGKAGVADVLDEVVAKIRTELGL